MRVLWFSITPSLCGKNTMEHNGGGWIESLERIVTKSMEVKLGIAYVSDFKSDFKINKEKVTYYPMYISRTFFQKVRYHFTYDDKDRMTIRKSLEVIEDFKPDIIQIFGSEWCFGLLKEHTNIPIVIHMQGSWPAYRNSTSSIEYSDIKEYFKRCYNPKELLSYKTREVLSLKRALREEHILRINTHYMGRTRWDKAIVRLYAPEASYYHCSEALRDAFVNSALRWQFKDREKITLVTTGSCTSIKGLSCVLKTALLIKDNSKLDFEWHLLGATTKGMKLFEKHTGIKCSEVNVYPVGRCEANEVRDKLLNADVYVHTAVIDNSPNAICEAQYLGMPVISTNVGGIRSLFADDYRQDMLVPANDPYYLASKIIELSSSGDLMRELAASNIALARSRHSDENVGKQIISIYNNILDSPSK